MGRLAVIGTFYQRRYRTELLLNRVLLESTRPPDEFWMMCEEDADANAVLDKWNGYPNLHIVVLNTPRTSSGEYEIIPYSNKINWALDHSSADYIVYLDNNSLPHVEKYRLMSETLDANPSYGAVFCSQNRTGFIEMEHIIETPIADAYCELNYTQVMHRKTADRWTLEMKNATPNDIADAIFWRALHLRFGPFYPVLLGKAMLDEHHIPNLKAVGL